MPIIYLHGFRSNHLSEKAVLTQTACLEHHIPFACPDLDAEPQQAIAQIQEIVTQKQWHWSDILLIGSSLGGFYARYLANEHGCRAVFVNPCVFATRDLSTQLHHKKAFNGVDDFIFKPHFLIQLQQLFVKTLHHPEQHLLFVGQSDEVLNWREMLWMNQGVNTIIKANDTHRFESYSNYLADIIKAYQNGFFTCK
ncbi:YqiA/YcfP family alpha/beta fold hydrolase [Basilea psittacipulmonis]|uniref:YqiA/YcfP family alpha/beta fold hydrolase n=1 Tax=Basilea psittacipulmonis TaxID=1472345 RepID=UPI0006907CB8|nr:YqiA/YcfP family alpha/beta fold hydrolase [Basilea psittacipulmonis]